MAHYVDVDKLDFEPDEHGGANGVVIFERQSGKTMRLVLGTLKRMVEQLPNEDVAPVVHGRWKRIKNWFRSVCSECHIENDEETRFCPHCGAKMDLEEI